MESSSSSSAVAVPAAPDNANAECVGPDSARAGTASSCEGCPNQASCASGETAAALAATAQTTEQLRACLGCVSHVILVLSGKGGVGKSTVATQLALTLAERHNLAVGLLDVDLCGPSAPRMALGGSATATATIHKTAAGLWIPVYKKNLAVMSISFLLPERDKAVIWRGPRKNALIQQFLTQVDWSGDTDGLDYLIIDTPPGTSDEHISTVQYLKQANQVSGAIVVTTPEVASLNDVRKELNFCQKTQVPILGLIENMGTLETTVDQLQFKSNQSGEDCSAQVMALLKEKCPELLHDYTVHTSAFAGSIAGGGDYDDGTEQMALDYQCPFWGRLPLDPNLLQAADEGECFATRSPCATAAKRFEDFCQNILRACPLPSDDNGDTAMES